VRILMIGRNPEHASSRVRLLQYERPVSDLGHDVTILTWQPRASLDVARLTARVLRLARWADVVLVSKPRIHPGVLDLLVRTNPNLVVDFDDAMWTWGKGFAARFDNAASRARVLIAGNAFLADHARRRYPRAQVVEVPSAVDLDRFPRRPHDDRPPPVTVGWIGNTASLTDFDDRVVRALRRVVDGGLATFTVVCSEPLGRPDLPETFVPWSADTELASLQSFDIGIMPLHEDEQAWGRCGLKAIQSMAVGTPVIASPIGAAPEIIDGTNGLLATDETEWFVAIRRLASDSTLRLAMATAARETVERRYCVGATLPVLLEALQSAVDR
jgi:glycosyltransferase involved in cell wall biosynthesis